MRARCGGRDAARVRKLLVSTCLQVRWADEPALWDGGGVVGGGGGADEPAPWDGRGVVGAASPVSSNNTPRRRRPRDSMTSGRTVGDR